MALLLEAFDADPVDAFEMPPLPNEDYLNGFAEGEAAAKEAFAQDQLTLKSELVQSVSDMAFGYEEASAQMIANLDPLFKVMLKKLLPATLSKGLNAMLYDLLISTAKIDALAPITISVHPDQLEAAKSALEDTTANLLLQSDLSLGPHAALTQSVSGESVLDLDAALSEINGVLDALPESQVRSL